MAKECNCTNPAFQLNAERGYFQNMGVDVMAFDDIYPVGHQSGVSILMHGQRVATNGDIRFEPTPGQWQPVPKQNDRVLDKENNTICTALSFPDYEAHLGGFNPIIYPDLEFSYHVNVIGEGNGVVVTVNLDKEIPEKYKGMLSFNLELYPTVLFGKPWIMDDKQGIFPRQANGPTLQRQSSLTHAAKAFPDYVKPEPDFSGVDEAEIGFLKPIGDGITASIDHLTGNGKGYSPMVADDIIAEPYAVGKKFIVRPDDPYRKLTIESDTELKLYDGRMNHNNGWFAVCSELPTGVRNEVLRWVITPNAVDDWMYEPVIQTSQVGYHPLQDKIAVIELDARDDKREPIELVQITGDGMRTVLSKEGKEWGNFLRFHYVQFDFSDIREEGLYQLRYMGKQSSVFRIAKDIYDRGVWQPVLEYFLPVQMCHMRVMDKYRVWHGHCHKDDARMAPIHHRHFDGYVQGDSTLTKWCSGDHVPGLNVGGWHDAGDYDLRIESQSGEVYNMTCAYEAFGVEYDATTIDQQSHTVEIHQPDGKNDILQQIEHGVLAIMGGYKNLGRLYRGIICNNVRQYVLLGDAAAMTDGVAGDDDDRWVFTEDNPERELLVSAHLAAGSRSLKEFNPELSTQALEASRELFDETTAQSRIAKRNKIHAAAELFLATKEETYKAYILERKEEILAAMESTGWIVARVIHELGDGGFVEAFREKLIEQKEKVKLQMEETPYGVPYKPYVWGGGWSAQTFGVQYYFLYHAFPDVLEAEPVFHALNFVLGCHPGSNTSSFASGVGAKSMTVAYGANRADWSYIPGGVSSGTALIRPDFPELLEFPFLWQQGEYVIGGGSSNYLFLVLAVQHILKQREQSL